MKKIFTMITVLTITLTAFATGYDHGNGGGVICINNKCQTLADSGLSISAEYPDFWIPSEQVLKNISKFIGLMPLPDYLLKKIHKNVLLKMTHFKVVTVVDPVKLDAIKQLYIDTLKATSPNFDTTHFKIVAISSDNSAPDQNTFLLPDFFDLDDEQQAKLLIHEGFYRGRQSSDLKYILQLESALKIFFTGTAGRSEVEIRKDLVSVQIAAYNLNLYNKSEVFAALIITTYSEFAKELTAGFMNFSNYIIRFHDNFNLIFRSLIVCTGYPSEKLKCMIHEDEVIKKSNLDSRTSVMFLNLKSPVEMKKDKNYYFFTETVGLVHESYFFVDPQNLNLLLPK